MHANIDSEESAEGSLGDNVKGLAWTTQIYWEADNKQYTSSDQLRFQFKKHKTR